jgi:hypothetical protein
LLLFHFNIAFSLKYVEIVLKITIQIVHYCRIIKQVRITCLFHIKAIRVLFGGRWLHCMIWIGFCKTGKGEQFVLIYPKYSIGIPAYCIVWCSLVSLI